jgi:hypothetical protein
MHEDVKKDLRLLVIFESIALFLIIFFDLLIFCSIAKII